MITQPAPVPGKERVFASAIEGLKEYVDYAAPQLDFALDITVQGLHQRVDAGFQKYGTYLETFNGRNAVKDAWEEAADAIFYIEQAMRELPDERRYPLFEIADLFRESLLKLTEQLIYQETKIGR